MDDNPVMRRASDGASARRFEELYAAHHPQIFGYVLRRCERAEDAADAIAETFLVLWRRFDELPADDEVRPWLYGVARRVLSNQRRGARRRSVLTQRLEAELAIRPMPLAVTAESSDDTDQGLREALGVLSADDREILMLEAWEELSASEIALVIGCSPGAARTRLHRARRRLRDRIIATHEATHLGAARKPDTTGGKIS